MLTGCTAGGVWSWSREERHPAASVSLVSRFLKPQRCDRLTSPMAQSKITRVGPLPWGSGRHDQATLEQAAARPGFGRKLWRFYRDGSF